MSGTSVTRSSNRLLLFYNYAWDVDPAANPPADCTGDWEISSDPNRFQDASAIVFHIPSMPTWSTVRKLPGQKWIAWSAESDIYYFHLRDPKFMARFDLTMTYRLDSDLPVLYVDPRMAGQLRTPPIAKATDALCALFASNSRERSGRSKYISELMRYVSVASFGRWRPNRVIANDSGRQTKLDTIARYKFTLAFENSCSKDYVSEKIFDPLIAGSVPVYQGTSNIQDFVPADHCFINVDDFRGPRELADYLRMLDDDPVRYEAYLAWKHRPFRQSFVDLVETQRLDYRSRLCRRLEAMSCGSLLREPRTVVHGTADQSSNFGGDRKVQGSN